MCAILGRSTLDVEARGCSPLLATWGGEAIYRGTAFGSSVLREIGTPTVVVCGLDLSNEDVAWVFSLGRPFVEKLRGQEPCAEISYRRDVPAEDVLDVWQPGHPEYDRHQGLPDG